jgi:hypothetical protein
MLYVLLSSLIVVACVATYTVAICLKQKKLMQLVQTKLQKAESDIRALSSGALGVGERIYSVEKKVDTLSDKQKFTEQRDLDVSSYSHAAKMVEMGASIEDIMKNCSLTQPEAELVHLLHNDGK